MASSVAHKKEQCLAAYLECGGNVKQVSTITGFSTRQIFRYVADPGFQREIEELKRSLVDAAVNTLRKAAQGAVDVLNRIAHDEGQPAAARVSAAKAIIGLTIEAATIADIEQRLKELEKTRTIDAHVEWSDDGKISRIA